MAGREPDEEASAPFTAAVRSENSQAIQPLESSANSLPSTVNQEVEAHKQLKDIKIVREEGPENPAATHELKPEKGEEPSEEREISEDAKARAEMAQDALERWGIFGGGDQGDKGQGIDSSLEQCPKEEEEEGSFIWRKRKVVTALLLLLSAGLISTGVILQVLESSPERKVAFRWCYFIAGIFPAYLFAAWFVRYLIHTIEAIFFHEFLAHLESLRRACRVSLFLLIVVIWQRCMFAWGWCMGKYADTCNDPTYLEASRVCLNIILCLFVASLATLLAAAATKLLSTHFYKSTHFKKLQAALDKEYRLKILSKPRPQKKAGPAVGMKRKSKVPGAPHSMQQTGSRNELDSVDSPAPSTSVRSQEESQQGHDKHQPRIVTSQPKVANHQRSASQGESVDLSEVESQVPSLSNSAAPSVVLDDMMEFHMDNLQVLNMEIVPSEILELDDLEVDDMTEAEMERLRTVVVIKTYSNLINQHKFRTPEEMKEQIKDVQTFAKALFKNIRGSDKTKRYISLNDFRDFYGEDKAGRAQALASFSMFAMNPRERVTKDKVIASVLEIFKERSNIAASLSNTESMMDSLHAGLGGALHFLFIGFYLLIWNVDVVQGFSTFSATVLALSFVFGNSIRNTFESMLFLFVQHPYDVGDRVEIDGILHSVVKISLLYTYFTDAAGRHITVANPSISQKPITNLSRTPTHLEFVNIPVDIHVAAEIRDALTERLIEHREKHLADLDPEVLGVNFTAMLEGMKINLFIVWNYLMPPDDFMRKRLCRDKVMAVIQSVLVEFKQKGAIYSYTHQFESNKADTQLSIGRDDTEAQQAAASAALVSGSHKIF